MQAQEVELPRPWRVLGILPDGVNQVRNIKGDDVALAVGGPVRISRTVE